MLFDLRVSTEMAQDRAVPSGAGAGLTEQLMGSAKPTMCSTDTPGGLTWFYC